MTGPDPEIAALELAVEYLEGASDHRRKEFIAYLFYRYYEGCDLLFEPRPKVDIDTDGFILRCDPRHPMHPEHAVEDGEDGYIRPDGKGGHELVTTQLEDTP